MAVGIERMNFYVGRGYVNVKTIFEKRDLNMARFGNLMMDKKATHFPWEDPVTHAVNAAKPIIDKLTDEEKNSIEMVITASESGVDFGKSLATYVHKHLGLPTTCRLFEVKQACYAGTASLQSAFNFVQSGASPGARALVISTDYSNGGETGFDPKGEEKNYGEPSMGTGAVAMLVSNKPTIFEADFGKNGYHSYEIWDTGRPAVGVETGDSDLSLTSYMSCAEGAYKNYAARNPGTDYQDSFDFLAFHTPFAGLVKSAHRKILRQCKPLKLPEMDADFEKRVVPSLRYCTQVGNIFSATVYLAVSGAAASAPAGKRTRLGVFSYGSGCSSEFYSGVLPPDASARFAEMGIDKMMSERGELDWPVYEKLLKANAEWRFGTQHKKIGAEFADQYKALFEKRGLLVLKAIDNYKREYAWS